MVRLQRLLATVAILALGSMAFASGPRPDVRRLNDSNQRLRASASPSAAVVSTYTKGEPFLVLETGTKRDSADGKAGVWTKVRAWDSTEGYMISTALDKSLAGRFVRADFPSDSVYSHYLTLALRRGERVKAAESYESVEAGDLGWFCSQDNGDPPFLVVWDRNLDATPSEDALDKSLPRILENRVYFVYAQTLEIVQSEEVADFSALALDWSRARADEFLEGAQVSLGAHLAINDDADSTNWAEDMEEFVGKVATITEVVGDDSYGRPVVRVDIDDGAWVWRIENMRFESASDGESYFEAEDESYEEYPVAEAKEQYGQIKVSSTVILGKHDEIDGDANWSKDMEAFVGKSAKVTSLSGSDSAGFLGVRVEGNTFFWRIRNLTLKGRGEAGGYGYVVGDKVILGRHRSINGDENWSVQMDKYVGQEATITELVGIEDGDGRCYLVSVDVDNGNYVWRVENLTPIQ